MTCSFVYSFVDSSDDEVEKDELGFEKIDIDKDNEDVDEIELEGINEASTDLLIGDQGVEGLEGDEVQGQESNDTTKNKVADVWAHLSTITNKTSMLQNISL
ncbi:hypothetical protein LIER_35556 [Lithospermum erythrorhizon]|uniref:Uncharacterized protein n=1 Tax=Lithospermum erythrorhizon TaxID=34254 RepID=A0AAV3NSF3_LITER